MIGKTPDFNYIFDEMRALKKANGLKMYDNSRRAVRWYFQNMKDLYKEMPVSTDKMIRGTRNRLVKVVRQGEMVLFGYRAQTQLGTGRFNYYDRYPLILVLGFNDRHILGVNLHMLYPGMRQAFFELVLPLVSGANTKDADNRARLLGMSYALLTRHKYRYGKACVRRYLRGRLTTPMLLVPSDMWATALHLPTMSIVPPGVNQIRVWEDTKRKIRDQGGI